MQSKFLPIGSVLLLKDGKKPLVICGYCAKPGKDDPIYDYTGILYPEGIQSANSFYFFNHSQIDKVLYIGYESSEYKELNEDLIQQFGGNNESS